MTDPSPIEEAVHRLDAALRERRPQYYDCLRDPLDEQALQRWEQELRVQLPAELRIFYRWKDGQSDLCPEMLYGDRSVMPADIVTEVKREYDELAAAGGLHSRTYWSPKWVPFLGDPAGNLLCVDAEAAFGGTAGQLVAFQPEGEKRLVEFPDLVAWLSQLAIAIENGDGGSPAGVDSPPGYPVELPG